ncbi:MAG: enoyl-CoA hydratase/isomerase family protein, partial [Arenicella sp.]|nr:enoyl-CoA hydratase/isomerase family protein [Arenicella sp.]
MAEYDFINYSVSNSVATIALNTPAKLNAFHRKMRLDLIEAIGQAEADDSVRIVILTGEGRAFSAGADLTEPMPDVDSFVEIHTAEYTSWLMTIHNSEKLYISAVNGACAGIGTAVAMNCDLMIMAEDAYLYQAFSAIGLMPDGGANWLLLHKLGYQRAIEMAIDAGRLSAEQCLELGIANKVVAPDELLSEAQ